MSKADSMAMDADQNRFLREAHLQEKADGKARCGGCSSLQN
jgi:hypothetical protein